MTGEDSKTCTKCGETYPATLEYFYKQSSLKCGLSPRCKPCLTAQVKAYQEGPGRERFLEYQRNYERDPEKERRRQREWTNGKGREKTLAKYRRWRANPANRTKAAAYQKAYREANAEQIAERTKRYRETNRHRRAAWPSMHPDKRRQYYARYRANKLERWIEDVELDALLLRDLGVCGICNEQIMESTLEVDHIIPLSRGGEHSYANTQLAHRTCNRRKSARLEGPATQSS